MDVSKTPCREAAVDVDRASIVPERLCFTVKEILPELAPEINASTPLTLTADVAVEPVEVALMMPAMSLLTTRLTKFRKMPLAVPSDEASTIAPEFIWPIVKVFTVLESLRYNPFARPPCVDVAEMCAVPDITPILPDPALSDRTP